MEHNEVVVTMIRLDLRKPHATPDLSNHWQQSLHLMRLQPVQSEHPLRGTQSNASLYREDKPGLCAGERGVYAHSAQW